MQDIDCYLICITISKRVTYKIGFRDTKEEVKYHEGEDYQIICDCEDETWDWVQRIDTFEDMGFEPAILRGILEYGFWYPSRLQEKILPVIMNGKDVLVKVGTI